MNFIELLVSGFSIDYLRAFHQHGNAETRKIDRKVDACYAIWGSYYNAVSA